MNSNAIRYRYRIAIASEGEASSAGFTLPLLKFTRKSYLELYRDDLPVIANGRNSNRHTSLVEAAEHATEHASQIGSPGEYEIRVDGGLYYVVKITEIIFDAAIDPPIGQPEQGEISFSAASYSGNENANISFTILRSGNETQRVRVDWAVTNANVSPIGASVVFESGDTTKLINVLAGEVGPTEVGTLLIITVQALTDITNTPATVAPSSATFTIIDLNPTGIVSGQSFAISGPGLGVKGGTNPNLALAFTDWRDNTFTPVASLSHRSVYSTGVGHQFNPAYVTIETSGFPAGSPTDTTHMMRYDYLAAWNGTSPRSIRWGHATGAPYPQEFFISLNRYYDWRPGGTNKPANMKTFRFYGASDPDGWIINDGEDFTRVEGHATGLIQPRVAYQSAAGPKVAINEWNNEQIFLQASSVPGSTVDGWIALFHNNVESVKKDTLYDQFGGPPASLWLLSRTDMWEELWTMNTFATGADNVWTNQPTTAYAWWDAWYFDDTKRNVMVGNAPVWTDCTIREIQPPTAWADGGITIEFRRGRLDIGINYIYVSDANGNYISKGTIEIATSSFVHGDTVIVNGSGFGTKATAAPKLWDTVDNQSSYSALIEGSIIPVGGTNPWQEMSGPYNGTTVFDHEIFYSTNNLRHTRSSANYRSHTEGGDIKWPTAGGGAGGAPASQTTMYVSFYWLPLGDPLSLGPGAGTSHSSKMIRIWDNPGGNGTRISWTQSQMTYGINGVSTPSHVQQWRGTPSAWNRLEIYVDADTNTLNAWTTKPNGIRDQIHAITDIVKDPASSTVGFNVGRVGWDDGGTNPPKIATHFGEIYIDDTQQRVEIGNADTWAASTVREIQIPTGWSDNNVAFTANQGALPSDQNIYVYVIDANGNPISQGANEYSRIIKFPNFNHGDTFAVPGSGYGIKSPAPPVTWDDASGPNIATGSNGSLNLGIYNPNAPPSSITEYRTPAEVTAEKPSGVGVALPHNNITKYICGAAYALTSGQYENWNLALTELQDIGANGYGYWHYKYRIDPDWVDNNTGDPIQDDGNHKMFSAAGGPEPYSNAGYWYDSLVSRGTGDKSYHSPNWIGLFDSGPCHTSEGGHTRYVDPALTSWYSGVTAAGGNGTFTGSCLMFAQNPAAGGVRFTHPKLAWWTIEHRNKHGNQGDGVYKLFINETLACEVGFNEIGTGSRYESIGGFHRDNGEDPAIFLKNWRYFADVYFDVTWARVMFANDPVYENATITEPQPPITWNDTITVTVNKGRLSSGLNYWFVFDASDTQIGSGSVELA